MTATSPLQNLTEQLHYQLSLLGLPEKNWLPTFTNKGKPIYDVAIIGAGMAGLTVAASLTFKGINNIGIFDAAPANQEGPWVNFARMNTLRSPKDLVGPALGIPALTFQAWFKAQYGTAAWTALGRIPKQLWHDYLQWYRQALSLKVANQHQLLAIKPIQINSLESPIANLELDFNKQNKNVFARHIVLATGMDGFGGPNIPKWVLELPQGYWRHSSANINMDNLKGKRVAIIGGRDSALDAAATALESGAKSVALCVRANSFAQINYFKAIANHRNWLGYSKLTPQQRSQLFGFLKQQATPPASGTVDRLRHVNGLEVHLNMNIQKAYINNQNNIELLSNQGLLEADYLILATGYITQPTLRPELQNLLPHIRYYEPDALGIGLPENAATIPHLNEDFSFIEQTYGNYPILRQIHCFNPAATFSLGKISSDIPAISFGANKLTDGIVNKLFTAEFPTQLKAVKDYADKEITDSDLGFLLDLTQ